MPAASTVKVGAWEDGEFIGAVIFSHGASAQIGLPFGMTQWQVIELTRVALNKHHSPVSKIVAIALRMLKKQSPGLRIVVSYADSSKGHVGGIYQAGNWIFAGGRDTPVYVVKGERLQGKTVTSRYGHARVPELRANIDAGVSRENVIKYRYLMPLDDEAKRICERMREPFPKRPKHAMAGDQPAQRRGSDDPAAPTLVAEC
jgi:hypothetical protein